MADQAQQRCSQHFELGRSLVRGLLVSADRAGSFPAADPGPVPFSGTTGPSVQQQEILLAAGIDPDSSVTTAAFAAWLIGPLDISRLKRCLRDLVRRHEALRMSVAPDGSGMLVQPDLQVPLRVLRRPVPASPGAVLDEARKIASEPFDMSASPLLRVALIEAADDRRLIVFAAHHLVCDGWSLAILLAELRSAYESGCAGFARPAPLYRSFVERQRQALALGATDNAVDFYRGEFIGCEPWMLPPRPLQAGERAGAYLERRIKPDVVRAVGQAAQRLGVTEFTLLLAAFEAMLGRISGQDDFVIGCVVANRNGAADAGLVGPLMNVAPVRARTAAGQTVAGFLQAVHRTALWAVRYGALPAMTLREALQGTSSNPVVNAVLSYQALPLTGQLGEVTVRPVPFGRGRPHYPLELNMWKSGDELTAVLEFSSDLFDRGTARRLLGWYEVLLAGVTADPGAAVGELPLMTAAESGLVRRWGTGPVRGVPAAGVPELVARQAAAGPERVAVAGPAPVTYAELEGRANRLGWHLRGLGAGPGAVVGVCAGRSAALVTGLLGVLKAGAAYLPLDPSYPVERLRFMLADAGVRVLLADASCPAELAAPGQGWQVVDPAAAGPGPATPPPGQPGPRDLAYVMYTSGSTGRPKGVLIEHQSLTNLLLAMAARPGFSADDTLVAVTSISFDMSVPEFFLPLISGGSVVIADAAETADPQALAGRIAASSPTVMQATPATWQMLTGSGWRPGPLRLLCGGEALPPALASQLLAGDAELWNLYGPTEATVYATGEQVTNRRRIGPIGGPLANMRVYVLDGGGELVPPGVAGELFIGGVGVARGYHGRPGLTAERFVPDPFSGVAGARLYRTGDRCRWLADGSLEFVGRIDHQVKLRGFRIEPAEIEAVLAGHPDVSRVAVLVAAADRAGGGQLVAYVVTGRAGGGEQVLVPQLRELARRMLPDYMVPAGFVLLEELPLTPNGKLDRAALPGYQPHAVTGYVAPRDDTERALAGIFAGLLGAGRVGAQDNFFELGGHSLLVPKAVDQIQQHFRTRIPFRTFMENPTISNLAAAIKASPQTEPPEQAIARRPRVALTAERSAGLVTSGNSSGRG